MKVNELEIYKALKVLTKSGYVLNENHLVTENRTLDVEELVTKYKNHIMKMIRQKMVKMLDKLYDGDTDFESIITIEIPGLMMPVTDRPTPVKMKPLTVKLYTKRSEINRDYEIQKGKDKGALYADSPGDTNPDLTPVLMMLNLPIITLATEIKNTQKKNPKNFKENTYASGLTSEIPFPETREQFISEKNETFFNKRTAERDALYARFRDKYGINNSIKPKKKAKPKRVFDDADAFVFKDAVEEFEYDSSSPMQIIDKIMQKYFGAYFQEVLHHELTHYIQANNKELDGTENAKDYDAEAVVASGEYYHDPLEYEAKLHQNFPLYINAIRRSKNNISTIAKNLVNNLFSNHFSDMSKEDQHKYYKEILKLCQIIKTHKEITRYNFNTPKIKQLIRNSL